jgi:hypothetical protein
LPGTVAMSDFELGYIRPDGRRVKRIVTPMRWQATSDGRFRTRMLQADDEPFAVQKSVPEDREDEHGTHYESLENEARVLLRLATRFPDVPPPGLTRALGHDMDGRLPFLLYAPPIGQPISEFAGDMNTDDTKAFVSSLFRALDIIHSARIIHGALDQRSVLWDAETANAQITEFGRATFVGQRRRPGGSNDFRPPAGPNDKPHYSDDVWSAGMVAYYAVTNEMPKQGVGPDVNQRGPQLAELFANMFAPDPKNRPSARAVLGRMGEAVSSLEAEDIRENDAFREGVARFDDALKKRMSRFVVRAPAAPTPAPPEPERGDGKRHWPFGRS